VSTTKSLPRTFLRSTSLLAALALLAGVAFAQELAPRRAIASSPVSASFRGRAGPVVKPELGISPVPVCLAFRQIVHQLLHQRWLVAREAASISNLLQTEGEEELGAHLLMALLHHMAWQGSQVMCWSCGRRNSLLLAFD